MNSDVDLSIIVPTFNRAGSLRNLLASIDALECLDSVRAEMIVVDNGSTDDTGRLLAEEKTKLRKLSLGVLREKRRGKASALNCGLKEAQGKIICILDDDVVVDPRWMENLLAAHRRTSFDVIQGRVLPGVDGQGRPADPRKLQEYNIPISDHGEESREISGFIGANVSFKRETFEKVGGFDIRLGPGASGFGEDSEYAIRIRRAGLQIGYTPDAVVYHELNPERYGRSYHREVHYRRGLSTSVYCRNSILFNLIPNLTANFLRYVLYRVSADREKSYRTEGRLMKYWGCLCGEIRQRTIRGRGGRQTP